MSDSVDLKSIYEKLYDRGDFTTWSRDDDQHAYERMLKLLNPGWIHSVDALDIGCGIGKYALWLARMGFKSVLGIDFVERIINEAQKNAERNLRFLCADFFHLKIKNRFGFFFDRGVFTHLKADNIEDYFSLLDALGEGHYRVLLTCFAEEYHLNPDQKAKESFRSEGLLFRKYAKNNITNLFRERFHILKLEKDFKTANRVFWHLLAERV